MLICCFTRTAFPFTSWYCPNSLFASYQEFFTAYIEQRLIFRILIYGREFQVKKTQWLEQCKGLL